MKFPIKGFLFGLSSTLLWASVYPISRLLMLSGSEELPPLPLTWVRLAISSMVVIPLMCLNGSGKQMTTALKCDWKMLIVLALLGNVLEGYLLLSGLSMTTAARASLMANASPIFTVIIAFLLLHEKVRWSRWIGMVIGFAGIAWTILGGGGSDCFGSVGLRGIVGDLLALGSGLCWAAFTVCGTGVSNRHGGGVAAILAIAFASVILLPFMFIVPGSWMALYTLNWQGWLVVLYLSLMANAVANIFWYKALKELSPGALGAFGYISATISALMSVIILQEKITVQFVISLLLVVGAVALMMHQGQNGSDPDKSVL